jgi:hypothetical protein
MVQQQLHLKGGVKDRAKTLPFVERLLPRFQAAILKALGEA